MDFHQLLALFEQFLTDKTKSYFPLPSVLNEAIRYSLLSEGKRIRPLLCLGFSQAFKGNQDQAFRSAMAVEMIHAYSLIHDDLPAMDNDDMRRGRPTNHKVYGEALAILAGDSLLNMAPEFLIKELRLLNVDPNNILDLVTLLLEASGHEGMIKGQSMDMAHEAKNYAEFEKLTLESTLNNIHKLKTGALITWSCVAGLHSHSDANVIKKFNCQVKSIGQRIGLLFQIVDDIIDVTSDLKALGKTPGKDQTNAKLTYTNLHGVEKSTAMAQAFIQELYKDLEELQVEGNWNIIKEIIGSLEKKLTK
jgi:geranylgeranyl diphosphate synthase type II